MVESIAKGSEAKRWTVDRSTTTGSTIVGALAER
jgi:hypothetical protein